jgi:hypothetical protein
MQNRTLCDSALFVSVFTVPENTSEEENYMHKQFLIVIIYFE